ncbi:MAG: hypothetical protein PSN34_14675 [Urechidicola sp.]|nr:hypothetical protein [Urechidicola sp.]
MNTKKNLLYSEELVHPVFYVVPILFGNYALYDLFIFEDNSVLSGLVSLVISYLFYQILISSRSVNLKDEIITKGIYIFPLGYIKKHYQIPISDIDDIIIKQNEKLYYQILIQSKDDTTYLLKSIPNKNPALKEMERIKKILNLL